MQNNYFKKIFSPISIIFFSFFFFSQAVQAHVGGGPPILKINDKYAPTNPYAQQEITTLTIPLDSPPESYLINDSLHLEVDVESLIKQTTIPSNMRNDLQFRWSIAQGNNFENRNEAYQLGEKVTYTFDKQGSYLLILEAKSPQDSDFVLLDTVQLNILPDRDYQLPEISVFVGVQGSATKRPVLFVSRAIFDETAKEKVFLWDFIDGTLHEGLSFERKFDPLSSYNTRLIYHRVIDSNNFITDIGFAAEYFEGDIHFNNFNSVKEKPFVVGTYRQASQMVQTRQIIPIPLIIWLTLLGIGIILLLIFCVIVIRKQPQKK